MSSLGPSRHFVALQNLVAILPMTLSRTPSLLDLPPPTAGEQTAEVLAEFGVGKDAVEGLRAKGVV